MFGVCLVDKGVDIGKGKGLDKEKIMGIKLCMHESFAEYDILAMIIENF